MTSSDYPDREEPGIPDEEDPSEYEQWGWPDDPWPTGSIIDEESDRGATAVYNQMVHRTTDGSDPLVPEPGP
jgi:hypothetical protein